MQPPPSSPNDPAAHLRALAEACTASRGEDRATFAELNERLGPAIRAFFVRRVRPGRAAESVDDLCQRVWIGLFEAFARGRYDPTRSSVTTFVYAIAAKTWLRHLRKATQSGAPTTELAGDPGMDYIEAAGFSDGPDSEAADAELLEAVRRCLRERDAPGCLTDEEHAIVVAAAAGASDRTLAERFGLAASTINAKKQSGWEKLRRSLARLGHRADSAERGHGGDE